MRLLKNNLADLWPHKAKCVRCESELEVDLMDVRCGRWKVAGYHFAGTAVIETRFTFKCPVCAMDGDNVVDPNIIPAAEQERMRSIARANGERV